MTNTQHTQGPWKAVQHPREHKWAWTIEGADGVGQSIARMGLVNDAQAVAANAALIAAAPAMYEALQWARQYLRMPNFHPDNSYNSEQWARDYNKLTDALAQAEGHQHG